jgi:hypothetical protein
MKKTSTGRLKIGTYVYYNSPEASGYGYIIRFIWLAVYPYVVEDIITKKHLAFCKKELIVKPYH